MFGFMKKFNSAPRAARRSVTPVVEPMEGRQMMAVDLGVGVNDTSSAFTKTAIPALKALGATAVRIWIDPGSWGSRKLSGPLKRVIEYKKAGFKVLVLVAAPGGKVASASAVKGWFSWAVSQPALKNAIDSWQIGNETEYAKYWKGSPSQYVNQFLKPAAEVLRPKKEPVISAAPSWNPDRIKQFISYGMLNYVDYIGFHPYANSVDQARQRIAQLKSIVAGRKPVIASEWNIRGLEKKPAQWAASVASLFPSIKGNFTENYYYALKSSSTMAGKAGLLTSAGKKTQFYSALMGSRKARPAPIAAMAFTGSSTTSAAFSNETIKLIDAPTSSSVL